MIGIDYFIIEFIHIIICVLIAAINIICVAIFVACVFLLNIHRIKKNIINWSITL